MIIIDTVKRYANYTISKYTYSADVSATGEELISYEVYDKDSSAMVEVFDTLEDAIDFVEDQQIWDGIVCGLPGCNIERY